LPNYFALGFSSFSRSEPFFSRSSKKSVRSEWRTDILKMVAHAPYPVLKTSREHLPGPLFV